MNRKERMPVPKTILRSDEHTQHIWQKAHNNAIEMKPMEKERVLYWLLRSLWNLGYTPKLGYVQSNTLIEWKKRVKKSITENAASLYLLTIGTIR